MFWARKKKEERGEKKKKERGGGGLKPRPTMVGAWEEAGRGWACFEAEMIQRINTGHWIELSTSYKNCKSLILMGEYF